MFSSLYSKRKSSKTETVLMAELLGCITSPTDVITQISHVGHSICSNWDKVQQSQQNSAAMWDEKWGCCLRPSALLEHWNAPRRRHFLRGEEVRRKSSVKAWSSSHFWSLDSLLELQKLLELQESLQTDCDMLELERVFLLHFHLMKVKRSQSNGVASSSPTIICCFSLLCFPPFSS